MRRLAQLAAVIAAGALTAAGQLTITTKALPPATVGQAYPSILLEVSGDPGPITWSFAPESDLPFGFVVGSGPVGTPATDGQFCYGLFNNNNPLICTNFSVTTPVGTYNISLQATSKSTNQTVTQQYSLIVQNSLQIVTTSLPTGIPNQPYSAQLQASGGSGPGSYVWSILNGALPPGIALDAATGLLTGTPIGTNSVFTFTVQLLDAVTQTKITRDLSITLVDVILTKTLPDATINIPYGPIQLQATITSPPLVWSVLFPSQLPFGFTLTPGGVLSGIPNVGNAGKNTFIVQVSNPQSPFAANPIQALTLTITLGPLGINQTGIPPATQNVPYSYTLIGLGGIPPYTWSFGGAVPPGLSIASDTGAIFGTLTQTGTFQIPVILKDSIGGSFSQTFTFNVIAPITITNASLANGSQNRAYSDKLTATGGLAPYRWSLSSGSLPPPLILDTSTGAISGTPSTAGTFPFTVKVSDANNNSGTKAFSITIAATAQLQITSGDLIGTVLTAFSQALTATGGSPPYTWSITTGTLPAGLQLNPATGVISGTPTAGGATQVGVTVVDATGLAATKPIGITINLPATPPTSITLGATTQPGVSLSTGTPYPVDITGTLTLAFASSVGGTDNTVRFAPSGGRSLQFTVPANQTEATFTGGNPALITGTVAGTITLTASLTASGQNITPSPAPTTTVIIDPAVPVITSVALNQVSGGLNVVVTGYSNTREVSSGSFTFTVSSGNTLSQATLTVPLTSAYATWFNSTPSNDSGGQFKLTVPFNVANGSAAAVTRVSVTLTNAKGPSGAVSSP